eukprot:6198775-Pyramimonas_sp.AAC.1
MLSRRKELTQPGPMMQLCQVKTSSRILKFCLAAISVSVTRKSIPGPTSPTLRSPLPPSPLRLGTRFRLRSCPMRIR